MRVLINHSSMRTFKYILAYFILSGLHLFEVNDWLGLPNPLHDFDILIHYLLLVLDPFFQVH